MPGEEESSPGRVPDHVTDLELAIRIRTRPPRSHDAAVPTRRCQRQHRQLDPTHRHVRVDLKLCRPASTCVSDCSTGSFGSGRGWPGGIGGLRFSSPGVGEELVPLARFAGLWKNRLADSASNARCTHGARFTAGLQPGAGLSQRHGLLVGLSRLLAGWLIHLGLLISIAFATQTSALFSRQLIIVWPVEGFV